MALSFPVINETFQGSLTLVARATSQVPGLGAYHRQIRQLLDRLDRLSLAVESSMLTNQGLYQFHLSLSDWFELQKI